MDEIVLADASLPDDLAAIETLDTSFLAREMLAVESFADGYRLSIRPLASPQEKRFPLRDLLRGGEVALVARVDGAPVGFAAGTLQKWNRRFAVEHCYVHRPVRRRGIGTALMKAMGERAKRLDADHLWVETSNLDVPAVIAYRKWGFEPCGLDTSLYRATPAMGEVALFLSRPL